MNSVDLLYSVYMIYMFGSLNIKNQRIIVFI